MKTQLITTLFLLLSVSLFAQNKKNKYVLDIAPNYIFDIKKFKKKATNGIYEFYRPDGLKVEQSKRDDYYWEIIRKKGTPIEKRRYYDLSTGKLQIEGNLFYSCEVGIINEYDEYGQLTKVTDTETAFLFSLDDVIKLIKRKFGIDMTLKDGRQYKHMIRGLFDYVVYFNIHSPTRMHPGGVYLEINGTTGEIYYYLKDGITLINKREEREKEIMEKENQNQ